MDRWVGEHQAAAREQNAVEALHQRAVQSNLARQHTHVLELVVHRAVLPAAHGLRVVRELDLEHQVQLRRQELPAAQEADQRERHEHLLKVVLGQRRREVGDLVDLEAFVGLVDPVFPRLEQRVHVDRAGVIVDIVGALAVGEELDALSATAQDVL